VDVWTYFAQREREFEEMSVDGRDVVFAEEIGSGSRIGRMVGHVYFTDGVYLDLSERVEIEGNHVRRTDYAYFLVVDGIEYWGYERDPTHDPPVHRHTLAHEERLEADPISFKRACELAWDEVTRLGPS